VLETWPITADKLTMGKFIHFAAWSVLLALLSQQSYAQALPESERQKAQEERKQEEQKANDEAYKAMIKRTPSSNKKVDPWGSLRAAPGK
jgi:hypothetical protein